MKRLTISTSGYALAALIALLGVDATAQQTRGDQPAQEQQQADNPQTGNNERGGQLPHIRLDNSPLPKAVEARTSYAPIAKKIEPSVVTVDSTRTVRAAQIPFFNDPFFRRFFGEQSNGSSSEPETQEGLGSGVIVSEDGYIITNNHVVEDSTDIRVARAGGEEFPAKVVGTDPATDIAVLKVDATGLPAITLADSSRLQVGDTVLAVGNPFGIGETMTAGIVSGLGRGSIGIVDYGDFIQTDASINPGNSGGALTDVEGRLVGINTAILSRNGGYQGVGFAVPVNIARYVMDQIIEHGHVTRGYLGIYIQSLTPDLAKAFHAPQDKGALVASVSPGSPAAKAGLKEGDVITQFNGNPVIDSKHLRLMVAETAPDTHANLQYLRNGKERETTVTLGELKNQQLAQARGRGGPQMRSGRGGFLAGMQVAELDPQTRDQFNIPNDVQGLVITDVQSGSAAGRAGLQAGDVIEEVNHQAVHSLRDAASELRNERRTVLLRVWSNGGSRYVALETGPRHGVRER
jgi:serine protease Do